MPLWWGAAGVLVGVVVGFIGILTVDAGETWDEWVDASPGPVGRWLQGLAVAAFVAALAAPGIPDEARAFVVFAFFAACAMFFGEGIRRRLFAPASARRALRRRQREDDLLR